jgi:outer membrane protein assembly factor BamB
MARIAFVILFTAGLIGGFLPWAHAQDDWGRFRGPNGTGLSDAKNIPVEFREQHRKWSLALEGIGHSTPVVANQTVFVTSADRDAGKIHLFAVRATDGFLLWQKSQPFDPFHINTDNSYASSSPVADAYRVYWLILEEKRTVLTSFTHAGKQVWQQTFDGPKTRHGSGCSPMIVDDLVVFTLEHEESKSEKSSQWIAIDKNSGHIRWQLPRNTVTSNSFSTPCVLLTNEEKVLIFTSEGHGLTAVRGKDGSVAWELSDALSARAISSPVLSGNHVWATRKGELVAFKGVKGSSPEIAYRLPAKYSPYVPTPLVKDGLLYNFMDNGYVSCHHAGDGELIWREKPGGKFYGSPICIDDRLYAITREGDVIVLKTGETFEVLAVNSMGEKSHATLTLAGDMLIVRTFSKLFGIANAGSSTLPE